MGAHYERAGFDSLWVTDHIVLRDPIRSRYPSSKDGRAPWNAHDPWYESVVSLTALAAVTRRCELGVAVMAAATRQPVLLAKQIASISALFERRIALGVAAGWLAEEYEALGVDFHDRGARLEDTVEILRRCWSGAPEAYEGRRLDLPGGVLCYPVPAHRPSILMGGMSGVARRRAARTADGWLATYPAATLDPAVFGRQLAEVTAERSAAPLPFRVVVRITGSVVADGVSERLGALAARGATDLIVDADARDDAAAGDVVDRLRSVLPE
jgi:probable F420-dependent oxidoreductase